MSEEVSRRAFIRGAGLVLSGVAAYAMLTPLQRIFAREGMAAPSAAKATAQGKHWTFVVDTTRCIGCGRCVVACKLENNVPWDPACNRTWVERYRFTKSGRVLVDSPNAGIAGFSSPTLRSEGEEAQPEVTAPEYRNGLPDHIPLPNDRYDGSEEIEKAFFVPKLCNQCDNPPCVQVCPVGATYKLKDGVVLVDQSRCIGCRYCIQACPYGARYLLPKSERTPMGQAHVADKCTWCYHRITRGLRPACVEACPVGARLFGDLNDPESAVSKVVRENRVGVLKPDLGTKPRVLYVGLEEGVR